MQAAMSLDTQRSCTVYLHTVGKKQETTVCKITTVPQCTLKMVGIFVFNVNAITHTKKTQFAGSFIKQFSH